MQTYLFFGRLIPERALLDFSEVAIGVPSQFDVPVGQLYIQIIKSQVLIRFVTESEVSNILTLKNIVDDATRMLLDAVGFCYGYGYDLEIVSMQRPDSAQMAVFGIDIPSLKDVGIKNGISVKDVMATLAKSDGYYFRHALADAREAIRTPQDTGFFCYRAIESLKNCYASRGGIASDPAEAWEAFRAHYLISEDSVMRVKHFADPIRHGNYAQAAPISDKERSEVFDITWGIINAFVVREKEHGD
jgi:hypothetical protein